VAKLVRFTQRNIEFRDPRIKRKIYKIPSAIRKGSVENMGFRTPDDTLTNDHPRKQGPSDRLFVIEQKVFSETQKRNYLMVFMVLSLIPIFFMVYNSQEMLRKLKIKEISRKRRERLDKEHGIDRESFFKNMEQLNTVFRVTEKEEIEKMRQLGQNPREVSVN